MKVRALVDQGSQKSYLSVQLALALECKPVGSSQIRHCLFGGSVTNTINHNVYRVKLANINGGYSCPVELLDQKQICKSVKRIPDGPWMAEFKQAWISLTDVGHDIPDIEVLLGADVMCMLLTGKVQPSSFGLLAIETLLGWTVIGKRNDIPVEYDSTMLVHDLHVKDVDIQDLWRLDVLGIEEPGESQKKEDLINSAMKHFEENICINQEGRYEIALPFIQGHPPVAENREIAESRLRSTTKKLKENGYFEKYGNIFEDWEKNKIVEKVAKEDFGSFIPHRPVIKPSSATTPVRPVFDASARSKSRPSLNDCLASGPNLIELIPDILIKFRLKRFGIVSDIRKAFLQISVREEDRKYLQFLWWEHNGQLAIFRHRRVVFGVTCSPFLLAATLNHHINKCSEDLGPWCDILKSSFYVDNSITSVDSMDDVKEFVRLSTQVLKKGMFDLIGWCWNGEEIAGVNDPDERQIIPVLGMLWNTAEDTLSLDVRERVEDSQPPTKRKILSYAHQVFDPLGFTCPVTLLPKLLLQETWKKKCGWDSPVSEDIQKKFQVWMEEIPLLKQIQIPRWCHVRIGEAMNVSLHVFNDASGFAYGFCVFLRAVVEGVVTVQLLMAKARVAGTKKTSIPRLELLACGMGARMSLTVKKNLDAVDIPCVYWTDSSNALYWIKKNENWGQYVWNRVKEITELTDVQDWRHISGNLNPADLPSRGCSAQKLVDSQWWEGPAWLKAPEEQWPRSTVQYDMETIMTEKKKSVVTMLGVPGELPWYTKGFNSFKKMIGFIVCVMRLENKMKNSTTCGNGKITKQEDLVATQRLWKLAQAESFPEASPVF